MQNNNKDISTIKTETTDQKRVNIFDVKHSGNPSTNIFSMNSQINKKEVKGENKPFFPFGKIPAANIFNTNSNPTPSVNIFSCEKPESPITQIKNPSVNKSPITAFNFFTPIKELSSSKLDSVTEEKKLSEKKLSIDVNEAVKANSKEQRGKQQKTPQQKSINPFPPISPKSQSQTQMKNSPRSIESKHIQLFSRSSSQKKISHQYIDKKLEESFDLSPVNGGKQNQKSMSGQMQSVEGKTQSKDFQNLTFQKRSDSKKLQNGEISFGDNLNLREQVNNTFSVEQKIQTPKKNEQKALIILNEQKILSVIQEKQGQQSPFHRIEIQSNHLSSKASSSPSYMNESSSPNLSYMDNVSSKLTSQKVSKLIFSSVMKEQQKQLKNNQRQLAFQEIQIQSKTQSQNIIHVQKIQFPKQQEVVKQSQKSEPRNVALANQELQKLDSLEARKQKRAQDFKSYLERNSTKKSPETQVPKVSIKMTESESDSQSHSFSSRDLGVSRHEQRSKNSPFKEPIGKFINIQKKNVVTTGTGGQKQQKSNEKEFQIENKNEGLKVGRFIEAKQPQRKPIFSVEKEKEQKSQKQIENDSMELDKTNSLDYSHTTHKIQSSINTLVVKSLIQRQKGETNQYEIGKTKLQNNIKKHPQTQKQNESKQPQLDDSDQNLEVPTTNQRKFTFGKTLQIHNQFKLANGQIENSLKQKWDKTLKTPNSIHSNGVIKTQEPPKNEQIKQQSHNTSKPFLQNKFSSPKSFQWPKPPLNQQTTLFSNSSNKDFSSNQSKQTRQFPTITKPSLKPNEMQIQTLKSIKHELQEAKMRMISKIGIFKKQIFSFDQKLKQLPIHFMLDQHKQTAFKIYFLIVSAFRSQNYYDLKEKYSSSLQIQSKIYTSQRQIQKFEMCLNLNQKWSKKLKQISETYLFELDEQQKEIQREQTSRKNSSFFTTFNIKRNKYCSKDVSQLKYAIANSDNKKPKKALSSFQSTLKQILYQKTQQSLNFEAKCQEILQKKNYSLFPNLLSLNQQQKIPTQIKLLNILNKIQRSSDGSQNLKNETHQFFKQKKAPILQNRRFFKAAQQRFQKNLIKNKIELRVEKQHSAQIKNQTLDQQLQLQKKKFQSFMRRAQIRSHYQTLIGENKFKTIFGFYESESEIISNRQTDEQLRKEQKIFQQVEVNKEINKMMHQNVSIKLKCINFKPQVFLL